MGLWFLFVMDCHTLTCSTDAFLAKKFCCRTADDQMLEVLTLGVADSSITKDQAVEFFKQNTTFLAPEV